MAVLTAPRTTARWRQDPEVGLMLRVRDGDAAAFTELERIYRTRVLGWFCRRLGDRSGAEDSTREVFLRLYRARRSYEPGARFATWVFHITQNVARNALRSRRRRPTVRLEAAASESSLVETLLLDRAEPPSRPLDARRAGRRRPRRRGGIGRPAARRRRAAPVRGPHVQPGRG